MIERLRKKHLVVWIALAVLIPVLFAAGLFLRHKQPLNETIPKVERNEVRIAETDKNK